MKNTSRRQLLGRSLVGALCSLAVSSWADTGDRDGATASARAPVWTEELGEVDLDQYTPEERAPMVRDYWTPERIKTAIPLDLPTANVDDSLRGNGWKEAFSIQDGPMQVLSEPALPQAGQAPYAVSVSNYGRVNGKVRFRNAKDGRWYECSGSAVTSSSKRLVATAAHCVHGGPGGTWHQNWTFTPNYSYGSQPNGQFSASTFHTPHPSGWLTYGSTPAGFNYDVAFVVLSQTTMLGVNVW